MNLKNIFKIVCSVALSISWSNTIAQEWSSPEIEQMYQQGAASMSRGNASEAVAIFQKIVPLEPNNVLVKKSLAQAYQLSGNNTSAIEILEPLFANNTADAESYRIAAQSYSSNGDEKKAQKILSEGISKNPSSGLLFYEQGQLYKKQKNYESALKCWLDGIEADPNFHLNYYEAAIAYVQTDRVVWAIIYGEIFVNKEPNTQRGNDTRILLLDAYQKLFFTPAKDANGEVLLAKNASNFEEAVKKTYLSLFFVVSDGITTENLTMLRSRFAISWKDNYVARYPFSLFSYQEDLMKNGYFDVYNQWLFGKAENPQQYGTWADGFADDIASFEQMRAKNPLRMQAADNYNTSRNFKGLFADKNLKR